MSWWRSRLLPWACSSRAPCLKETARQSLALFGDKHLDPPGEMPGLFKDVKDLKYLVYRGLWLVAGGLSVGGFFIGTGLTTLGLLIEWSKRWGVVTK